MGLAIEHREDAQQSTDEDLAAVIRRADLRFLDFFWAAYALDSVPYGFATGKPFGELIKYGTQQQYPHGGHGQSAGNTDRHGNQCLCLRIAFPKNGNQCRDGGQRCQHDRAKASRSRIQNRLAGGGSFPTSSVCKVNEDNRVVGNDARQRYDAEQAEERKRLTQGQVTENGAHESEGKNEQNDQGVPNGAKLQCEEPKHAQDGCAQPDE